MKLFSKGSEYAIRIVMEIMENDVMDSFSPKDVCQDTGIPEPFSRKILGELVKVRILRGTRGPRGGYQLARDPGQVSLLDIVLAVDGAAVFSTCPLGFVCENLLGNDSAMYCEHCTQNKPGCGLEHACPLHGLWKDTRTLVVDHLASTTLQDIRERVIQSGKTLEQSVTEQVAEDQSQTT